MMNTTTTTARARPRAAGEKSIPQVPSVLAIVVTHDGRSWLRDCLVGLNNQTYPLLDVLVVDDSSPDARTQPRLNRIAKRHLRGRRWGFLRTPRPLGFGGAINWALSRVRTRADFLLFIHDDAALDRDGLERMIARALDDESTAIVGPKIVAWDDVSRLEEIGMAADRFGYPYKGLEEGEIDLGQHDISSEVFYVTSTCMLVRHDVFRDLRGWDARLRAFAEDLDLCWRARVAGHTVRVEPLARARHAIALATGRRRSRFLPTRYFIRRNRLRTVLKNASSLRLLALIPQFVLLTFAEMIAFIVLRQPREIVNLGRALGWNLVYVPQTLTERARVQRSRKVPDRRLRRLTVRETTRVRAYIGDQAQRLEDAWGRRAEFWQRRGHEAKQWGERLKGWPGVLVALGFFGLLLAFRNLLWEPPASVGDLLPYPDNATAMWRAWLSPWQPTGLGHPGPAPPAFALLGIMPILTLGSAGAAQKLLVLGLGVVGFAGAYMLVSGLVDRVARVSAGVVYAFGGVGYAALRHGDLGAMVFGATAPFILLGLFRFTGWMRPPAWDGGRALARLAFGAAVSAAFVPGSLVLYALIAVVLALIRGVVEHGQKSGRGLVSSLIGLALGWALLLPWSATWFSNGGVFDRLLDDSATFAASWHDHGMASVLLGQTPDGPALFGLALPLLGLLAVLIGEGQRRRVALALWAVVVGIGLLTSAVSIGVLDPIIATPTEGGVLAAVAFAGLAGIGVGAFRLDLPRRDVGWLHAVTIGGLAFAVFMLSAGAAPSVWRGEWAPGRDAGVAGSDLVDQIRSLLAAEAGQVGSFRALWVGDTWTTDEPSAAFPVESHFLTGARGRVLSDLFQRDRTESHDSFERVVASIEEGLTDRGGTLLGAFNVHFVVLEPSSEDSPWLHQRDLAIVRDEKDFLLLEAAGSLDRAAVYTELPPVVDGLASGNATRAAAGSAVPRAVLDQTSSRSYATDDAEGPGVVFLAEASAPRWEATFAGRDLESSPGGWGNGWELPRSSTGRLVVSYPRTLGYFLTYALVVLGWIVVVGAAFSKRRRLTFGRRPR